MKPRNRNSRPLASIIAAMIASQTAHSASATWGANSNTAWYSAGNWVGGIPGTQGNSAQNNDIATFTNAFTGTAVGINMNSSNAYLNLGAISVASTRTTATTVGNSSTTAISGNGQVLRFWGATVNSIERTFLSNAGSGLLTLQQNSVGGNQFMNITMGYAGDNVIQITDTGGITIRNNIEGNYNNLVLTGGGSGVLTLTGANTFYSDLTINQGSTLNLGGSTNTGSFDFTTLNLAGGTMSYTRTGTVTQAFSSTNLTSLASNVSSTGATTTLNLGGISRTVGATLNFGGRVLTDNSNNNGILGGWATFNNENWAVSNGISPVTALGTYTATNTTPTTFTNRNMDVTSGATTVSGGIINTNSLRFSGANAKTLNLVAGNNVIQSGGILVRSDVGNFASTINGGNLYAASGVDLVIHQHNTSNVLTIGSRITDNGTTGLTKSGAGRLNLTATNNSYLGKTSVNAGTLAISAGGSLPGLATNGRFFIARGATLAVLNGVADADITSMRNTSNFASGALFAFDTSTANRSYSAALAGTVDVQKIGANTLTLSAANSTYTGVTRVTEGTLSASTLANAGANSSIGAFATAGAAGLLLNGGTFSYAGSNVTTNRGFTITANSIINVGATNTALTMGNFVYNFASTAGLTTTGATGSSLVLGNFSLSGGNRDFVANIPTTLGTVTYDSSHSLQSSGSALLTVGNLSGSVTGVDGFIVGGANSSTAGGLITGIVNNSAADGAFTASPLSSSVWTFSGSSFTLGTGALRLAGTGTFRIGGSSLLGTAGTFSNAITMAQAGTFEYGSSANQILSGNITGAVAARILMSGSGRLTLSGSGNSAANTYRVTNGVLQFARTSALYSSGSGSWTAANLNVQTGGTLAFNVGGTNEFTANNVTTLLTNLAASSSATNGMNSGARMGFDTTNASGGSFTISGLLANTTGVSGGARGFTKLGTNILVLSNTNTFTGVTTLTGGTLSVSTIGNGGTAGNLGQATAAAGNLVFDGGILNYTGSNATSDRAFTINAGKTATINSANNISFAGATGTATTGALTKTGNGALTLTGINTNTGATAVNGGTLRIDGSSAVGSAFTVSSSGTLAGSGTVGGTLALSGKVAPGNAGVDIRTLNVGATTVNSGSIFQFDLASTGNASDKLAINGAFTKGSGTGFQFNFMGSTPTYGTTFTLATFTSRSLGFVAGDFTYTGLGAGPYGTSSFTLTNTALTWTAVPEASNLLIGSLLGLGMMNRRRKQA